VASLERPGGNVTGLTNLGPGAQGRRLELLTQVAPGAPRFAFVITSLASNPANAPSLAATREAAGPLGVEVVPVEVPEPGAFPAAFDRMRDEEVGGFIFYYTPFPAPLRDQVFGLALERRLPGVYETREFAQAGGLMAYGPNTVDLYRRTGGYVDRILKGADPADMAVGLPEMYDLAVNSKTAQALQLTIPSSVLSQATEVFQ